VTTLTSTARTRGGAAEGGAVRHRWFARPTPLPAALPVFAGGIGLIGSVARRRKQRALARLHVRTIVVSGIRAASRFVHRPRDQRWRECPLFRSLLGVKQTSLVAMHMSASDPKRTSWPLPVRWF
jgi:hypothetical protein